MKNVLLLVPGLDTKVYELLTPCGFEDSHLRAFEKEWDCRRNDRDLKLSIDTVNAYVTYIKGNPGIRYDKFLVKGLNFDKENIFSKSWFEEISLVSEGWVFIVNQTLDIQKKCIDFLKNDSNPPMFRKYHFYFDVLDN